ncbi:hypothetical protein AK812_SmicGene14764 [Symbiodinium microadriaticum]|uniref:Uncharacterized protein n=1 Tax=Symbiodinium microadriaticum TaxID=2951 RepID=A0A1Q9E4N5_SYMMI|nr:hypothetical protein AK812_SmicGene14764 [Symbiodinium microadriaticum]
MRSCCYRVTLNIDDVLPESSPESEELKFTSISMLAQCAGFEQLTKDPLMRAPFQVGAMVAGARAAPLGGESRVKALRDALALTLPVDLRMGKRLPSILGRSTALTARSHVRTDPNIFDPHFLVGPSATRSDAPVRQSMWSIYFFMQYTRCSDGRVEMVGTRVEKLVGCGRGYATKDLQLLRCSCFEAQGEGDGGTIEMLLSF